MFLRPLSHAASALVFFSRRTDMPFIYTTSLAKLHFPEDAMYEVSPTGSCMVGQPMAPGSASFQLPPCAFLGWRRTPTLPPG